MREYQRAVVAARPKVLREDEEVARTSGCAKGRRVARKLAAAALGRDQRPSKRSHKHDDQARVGFAPVADHVRTHREHLWNGGLSTVLAVVIVPVSSRVLGTDHRGAVRLGEAPLGRHGARVVQIDPECRRAAARGREDSLSCCERIWAQRRRGLQQRCWQPRRCGGCHYAHRSALRHRNGVLRHKP
eukprot:1712218-Prymnesium_polylepis.1